MSKCIIVNINFFSVCLMVCMCVNIYIYNVNEHDNAWVVSLLMQMYIQIFYVRAYFCLKENVKDEKRVSIFFFNCFKIQQQKQ